jgi:hypothetical protein
MYPFGESTIRRYQHDRLVARDCDRDEGVVAVSRRMDDLDPVGNACLDASLRLSFQDHDDRCRQVAGHDAAPHAVDELAGGTGSVTPPSVRPGTYDVRRIDEEHRSSFAH